MPTNRSTNSERMPRKRTASKAPSSRSKRTKTNPTSDELAPTSAAVVRSAPTVIRPSSSTSPYSPCLQTLFLSTDHVRVSFEPLKGRLRVSQQHLDLFHAYKNDVHSYFSSKVAAKVAAANKGQLSIYRHIGHVVLPKFQQDEKLKPDDRWFPGILKKTISTKAIMTDNFNLVDLGGPPLRGAWSSDHDLLQCLTSLSDVQESSESPWGSPFIVALAQRSHVERACDVKKYSTDFDLPIEIYAGRLLFELIACDDIQTLFSHLVPHNLTTPVAPLPKLTEHPVSFRRSPSPTKPTPLAAVMRRAESTGYATLTTEQKLTIERVVNVPLFPYQEQTVRWMIDKEEDPHSLNDYFWQRWSFTPTHAQSEPSYFYYFPLKGELRLNRPPPSRGGMIAEEMGLGKTVEALALIAAQRPQTRRVKQMVISTPSGRKPSTVSVSDDGMIRLARVRVANDERASEKLQDDPSQQFLHGDRVKSLDSSWKNVKIERWESHTTLVLCPSSLVSQWEREARRRAPSLSLTIWHSGVKRNNSDDDRIGHAVGPQAKDIILATYDTIRVCPVLSKIYWRRIILDESQVSRRSATTIAADLFNLKSGSRFLMTGTPFVNSLDDLKGQMAILRLWPFSLNQDGFWEQYISSEDSMDNEIVSALLDVTMMRHAKGQNLQMTLPPRTYETIRVPMKGSAKALYYYILACCLEDVESQKQMQERENFEAEIEARRIRILFKQLMLVCLSPELFDATWVDLVRREALNMLQLEHAWDPSSEELEKLTPREAILYVASTKFGITRSSNRARSAVGGEGAPGPAPGPVVEPEKVRLSAMNRDQLKELALDRNLLPLEVIQRASHDRLVQVIMGGVHKLEGDSLKELRETAVQMGVATSESMARWGKAALKSRLKLHFEWLKVQQQGQEPAAVSVHESGYATLMRLITKKDEHPNCPVCLMDSEGRLAITKCGHLYCMDCMMLMMNGAGGSSSEARCAICRKSLARIRPVEVLRGVQDDAENSDEDSCDNASSQREEDAASGIGGNNEVKPSDDRTGSNMRRRSLRSFQGKKRGENVSQFSWDRPTAAEAMRMFKRVSVPQNVEGVQQNPLFPSLDRKVIQHLMAVHRGDNVAPKLEALLDLILKSEADVKFCVVAGSVKSLEVIGKFLAARGIQSVGSGAPVTDSDSSRQLQSGSDEAENGSPPMMMSDMEVFESNPNARVYLLNPSHSSGLTLTRASVVVFMEVLTRVADEVQASARVHRIGQHRPVKVVRILTENTVEEVVVNHRRGEVNSADEEWIALCSPHDAADKLLKSLFWG